MGQQQLLLLVLGIVIVGLAVVVGIQAFGENQKKANSDALVNDGVRIASDAQAWSLKPAAFGGPIPGEDIADASFAHMGYDVNGSGRYENLNGEFALSGAANVLTIHGCSQKNGNDVSIEVSGSDPGDITTTATQVTTCVFV